MTYQETYQHTMQKINKQRQEIMSIRSEMRKLQGSIEPEVVEDATFSTLDGSVRLSELFGEKDTLFVVHNMGKSCPSCTQWADGFNGVIEHLEDRAAFVISSPDSPLVQSQFAKSRGWKLKMISHEGTNFAEVMGYIREYNGKPSFWPGVSVFKMQDSKIVRVSDTSFGPGDDFNSIWNFWDMIPEGPGEWDAKFSY